MESKSLKAIGDLAKSMAESPTPVPQGNITEYARDPIVMEECFVSQTLNVVGYRMLIHN